jgi:phage regulator Rha-like protein
MKNEIVLLEEVITMIYWIRNEKVMLDRDLANLYGVETKVLKQAVKRNIERFPSDFMFVLNNQEFTNWRSQFVTSNSEKMGLRYSPMVFTEQGVAMLSSVLNSKVAIQVNIQIIRAFVRLRHEILNFDKIQARIDKMEREINGQLSEHQDKIQLILEAIKQLIAPAVEERRQIGYKRNLKS